MLHTLVRARLYQVEISKEKKVIDFCERFDSIVSKYESREDSEMTSTRKWFCYYCQSVCTQF